MQTLICSGAHFKTESSSPAALHPKGLRSSRLRFPLYHQKCFSKADFFSQHAFPMGMNRAVSCPIFNLEMSLHNVSAVGVLVACVPLKRDVLSCYKHTYSHEPKKFFCQKYISLYINTNTRLILAWVWLRKHWIMYHHWSSKVLNPQCEIGEKKEIMLMLVIVYSPLLSAVRLSCH